MTAKSSVAQSDRTRTVTGLFVAVASFMAACGGGAAVPSASDAPGISETTRGRPSAVPVTVNPSVGPAVAGCVPECLRQRGSAERPVGAGSFTTSDFFAGALTIILDEGWTVEDGTNELIFHHAGRSDWFIFVWIDPFPVSKLRRVDGVERSPAALVAWLEANPTLSARRVAPTTVASGFPAVAVDLSVSDKATLEEPDCPDLCTNYFGFENGPEAHGLARPGVTRIFLAPITYGGRSHLLTVSYEALDGPTFDRELDHAQRIIDTIQMPVEADIR